MHAAPVGLVHYLLLASLLFAVGAVCVVARRSLLVVLMGIELMLNGANLAFLAFSRFPIAPRLYVRSPSIVDRAMEGHVAAFFVIAVAAAEASVGLAIAIAVFRSRQTVHLDEIASLKH